MLTSHSRGNTATGLRQAQQENRGSITSVQIFPLEHCLPSPNVNALKPEFNLTGTSTGLMHKAIDFVRAGKSRTATPADNRHHILFALEQDLNNNLVFASPNASVCTCQLKQ